MRGGGRGGLALVSEGCFQVLSCPTLPGGSSGGGGGGSGGGGRDNGDNSCGDGLKWSTRRWAQLDLLLNKGRLV